MYCEYQRVKDHVLELISKTNPGALLPPESRLQNHLGVSRVTVRKALSLLERDGLIIRRKGKGTFVQEQRNFSRQLHIVVLLPGTDSSSAFCGQIITGYLSQSTQNGTRIHLIPMTDNTREIFTEIEHCQAEGVMIIAPKKERMQVLDNFTHYEKPVMIVNRPINNSNFSYVSSDHAGGTEEAVRYLIDKGHTRIAFVGLDQGDICIKDRHEGYLNAFLKSGITVDPALTFETEIFAGDNSFYKAAKPDFENFFNNTRPSALMVSGAGTLCHTVMPVLDKLSTSVEIASFDRIPYEYAFRDKIHEVIQTPYEEIGKIALWNLERIIKGETGKVKILLPPTFITKN